MAAWANAVPESAAPINHKKKPMQSNTTPEVIQLRLISNGGRELGFLIMVLTFERVADPRWLFHHALVRLGRASPRPGEWFESAVGHFSRACRALTEAAPTR